MDSTSLKNICNKFNIIGNFIDAKATGSGHINDTYLITTSSKKYILQKINNGIFKNITALNNNIMLATNHFREKQKLTNNFDYTTITYLSLKNSNNNILHNKNDYWRMMEYIQNTTSVDMAFDNKTAFEAAAAFGYFQKQLLDLKPDMFYPIIKDFHNLEMRTGKFYDVVKKNKLGRNKFALDEINFVNDNLKIAHKYKELIATMPQRVTHNDTKINNVLLDIVTNKGVAVIDLDTVMPGYIILDFGDMIRTFSSPTAEDEVDISKVKLRVEIFKAMAEGYLSELNKHLLEEEKNNLVFGGQVMTFMIGLRFLTDYLEGDIYFKTISENQNLARCKTQFKLLTEIYKHENQLNTIINDILA